MSEVPSALKWTEEQEDEYNALVLKARALHEIDKSLTALQAFSPADKLLKDIPEPYFMDLNFAEEETPEGLLGFIEKWRDPEFKETYLNLKSSLAEEYQTKPARYAGFIEESPALYRDVASASEETGVDPEFLYNVAMQEGLAEKIKMRHDWNTDPTTRITEPLYRSYETLDSFSDIGLDTFFMDQERALKRGYLDEPIVPAETHFIEDAKGIIKETSYHQAKNEAGLSVDHARIHSKDALRGVGALIRLNRDYLKSSFKKEGVDFDLLPEKKQNFWLYSAFNAGAGEATKLLKTYGADPYSNPKFVEKLKKEKELVDAKKEWELKNWDNLEATGTSTKDPSPEGSVSLFEWMENVGRVVGGTELTDLYKPWDDDLIYGDLKGD